MIYKRPVISLENTESWNMGVIVPRSCDSVSPCSVACQARTEHSRARLLPLPVGLSNRQF